MAVATNVRGGARFLKVTTMVRKRRQSDGVLINQAQRYLNERLRKANVSDELAKAWNRFFEEYDQVIRRFAKHCDITAKHLDDVVQDVWVLLLNELPNFEIDPQRASFRSWLYPRVRNVAVNTLRRVTVRRETAVGVKFDNILSSELEPPESLEMQWSETVFLSSLVQLQESIIPLKYHLFVMTQVCLVSSAELAAEVGVCERTVRYMVEETKNSYAAILEEDGFDQMFFPRYGAVFSFERVQT